MSSSLPPDPGLILLECCWEEIDLDYVASTRVIKASQLVGVLFSNSNPNMTSAFSSTYLPEDGNILGRSMAPLEPSQAANFRIYAIWQLQRLTPGYCQQTLNNLLTLVLFFESWWIYIVNPYQVNISRNNLPYFIFALVDSLNARNGWERCQAPFPATYISELV